MDRSQRAWMPVLTLPLIWAVPTLCSAQPPPMRVPTAYAVPAPPQRVGGLTTPVPMSGAIANPIRSGLPPALPPATSLGMPAVGGTGTGSPNVNPLARTLTFKPAPLAPGDLRFPINLATALRLSDARPLIVAAAQASVWVAEADLTRAKVLWVPTLNIGFDYVRHDGGGPDFNKGIMTAPSVNFLYGGVGLTGNGLIGNVNIADAIFLPLVARQILNARHWDVQTSKNDVLLQTANAYFSVHQSRGTYAGNLYTVERGPRPRQADRAAQRRVRHQGRDRTGAQFPGRSGATGGDVPAGLAGPERQPNPGPPARPSGRRRAAGARPRPDHPDRPWSAARRADADRADEPARAVCTQGAGPGRRRGDPP